MSKYYSGDVGTIILLDTGSDLVAASASFVSIKVKKPDATETEWLASIYNNNYLRYIIEAGDLDQNGKYILQAYVESPDWTGRGDSVVFPVQNKFN